MEDRELSAFIAGFKEGIRHYGWWLPEGAVVGDHARFVVGQRHVPVEDALALANEEAPQYYENYRKGRDAHR